MNSRLTVAAKATYKEVMEDCLDTVIPIDPLTVAADTGRSILESGGETYRAEKAVVSLCSRWGLVDSQCFATPTGLMASATTVQGQGLSLVRRVTRRSVDLSRIGRLAEAVEREETRPLGPEQFRSILIRLNNQTPYPLYGALLAAGVGSFFFTLLFRGSLGDAFSAFFVGLGIKLSLIISSRYALPDFIANLMGGSVAALISLLFGWIFPQIHGDTVIIGAVMLLVPGLATVNAIRDTIAGDLVAGGARLADAVMAAAAISLGVAFVLSVAGTIERIHP